MPRQHVVMVGSPVPLKGVYYDKETMTFQGIDDDDNLVKPIVTFSQTQYVGRSGKEKVFSRVQDKVIPHDADLMRFLSSFDLIIGVDTNTREIGGDIVSASGIIYCTLQATADPNIYSGAFPWNGVALFRNGPKDVSPEKYGWLSVTKMIASDFRNAAKHFCLVSDHDFDNHGRYNTRELPILKDIYLPSNFTIMYGRGDGSKENVLNHLVGLCDRESTIILKEIEDGGFCILNGVKVHVSQVPVLNL